MTETCDFFVRVTVSLARYSTSRYHASYSHPQRTMTVFESSEAFRSHQPHLKMPIREAASLVA